MSQKNTQMFSYIFLGTLLQINQDFKSFYQLSVGAGTLRVAQKPFENFIGIFLVVASIFLLIFWDKLPVERLLTKQVPVNSLSEETDEDRELRKQLVREEKNAQKELKRKEAERLKVLAQQKKNLSPSSQDDEIQRGRTREVKKEEEQQVTKPEQQAAQKDSNKKGEAVQKVQKVEPKVESKPEQKKDQKKEVKKVEKKDEKKDQKKVEKQDGKKKQESKQQVVQKQVHHVQEEDDDGWEQVEAPVVKSNKSKIQATKPVAEKQQVQVEGDYKIVTQAPIPVQNQSNQAKHVSAPAAQQPHEEQPKKHETKSKKVVVQEEEDSWDEVVTTKRDSRQVDKPIDKPKNKKKK